MEYRKLGPSDLEVSAVGLGTWVMGGWMWGDSEDREAEQAIEASLEAGVTLIDTAPVYGFGRAEEIVGRTIARLKARERVVIATKFGLQWNRCADKTEIRRNSSPERIREEVDQSRRRLQTDVIDVYQIHWPDESIPFEKTMEVLERLYHNGTIRAIGVSNFNVDQMERCRKVAPIHSLQPPYNLYERGIEAEILPYCREHDIAVLGYGALCRGLLTGKFSAETQFKTGDVRSVDPKFQPENLKRYVEATRVVAALAETKQATPGQVAIQWAARSGAATSALAGARNRKQAVENAGAFDFQLTEDEIRRMEAAVREILPEPIGPEFMAPPRAVSK